MYHIQSKNQRTLVHNSQSVAIPKMNPRQTSTAHVQYHLSYASKVAAGKCA